LRLSRFAKARAASGAGGGPSQRPVRARLRSRATRSLATRLDFSNCATVPRILANRDHRQDADPTEAFGRSMARWSC
jgi:hypothetical protein